MRLNLAKRDLKDLDLQTSEKEEKTGQEKSCVLANQEK
jgi:hypothetical protein